MKICTKDTASSNMPIKKDPVESVGQESWTKPQPAEPDDGAVLSPEDLARQKLDVSSEFESKQASEPNGTKVKTDAEQQVPEEPPTAGNIPALCSTQCVPRPTTTPG